MQELIKKNENIGYESSEDEEEAESNLQQQHKLILFSSDSRNDNV